LIEQIADLVKNKRIQGITDLRDESDRKGMRIMIELSASARPQVILNQLYKHTQLQQNFNIINLALVDGEPRVLTLRQCLDIYLKHRREVVRRRCMYELEKARRRAHILEGLLRALDHLDEIITLIRASASPDEARGGLISQFAFSEEQANAILDMRLQRLTGLERNRLAEEHKEVQTYIEYLEGLLADERRILGVIKDELAEIRRKYSDPRRSEIVAGESSFNVEDLIPPQDIFVSVSHAGYVKRMPVETYKAQRRGGKGITGAGLKEEDFLEHIFVTNTHHHVMFITSRARAYRLKGWEIPEASRQSKGTALVNKLDIEPGEKTMAVIPIADFEADQYLFMATKLGYVKKTALAEFTNLRRAGLIALTLEDGDELVSVRLTTGKDEIVMITRKGLSIRFPESTVRAMGRSARGVHGIKLREDDEVVSMETISAGATDIDLLVVTENGFGKRTGLDEYRRQGRGGFGLRTINVQERNGHVVSARILKPNDDLIICTEEGIVIRLEAEGISVQGRITRGVTLIRLNEGDRVSSVAVLPGEEESGEPGAPPSGVGDTEMQTSADDEDEHEAGEVAEVSDEPPLEGSETE
ncbi:MAG: DNA gyrase subunit A, partial [Armatimonadetes bacterium]|nr:DNA gyrase subunit A [Armatimonadota bacterium]